MSKRDQQKKRPPKPDFKFGVFKFRPFADWLLNRHVLCDDLLTIRADFVASEAGIGDELSELFGDEEMKQAKMMAYVAMLSIAIEYSVTDDIADFNVGQDLGRFVVLEPFRRARYMLLLHAKHLPVEMRQGETDDEATDLDRYAADVAGVFYPILLMGSEVPMPMARKAIEKMPKPVRDVWQAHRYSDVPLCLMMAVSFGMAFSGLVGSKHSRWKHVINTFWDLWTNQLLDVDFAIREENLNVNEELEGG